MTQRIRLFADPGVIAAALALAAAPDWRPSWNIAPGREVLAVLRDRQGGRGGRRLRWGLDPAPGSFNQAAETIDAEPAWQHGRRCLIVTDGYYEWRPGHGQPYAVARMKRQLCVLAGLCAEGVGSIAACTVVTVPANELMGTINDRMPAILPLADWPIWLGETPATPDGARVLLKPYPSDDMMLWPVNKRLNDTANDDAALCGPLSPTTRVHA